MTTLEEVYNAFGCEAPFDKTTGDLTDEGDEARNNLEQVLSCLHNLGVICGWNQDVLDRLEEMNV